MQLEPQIIFRNIAPSEAIEANVRKHIAKLDRFHERIMGCRVVIEAPHRHQHHGKLYHLRIDMTEPGGEVVVNHNPPEDQSHEDIYVAIRDAFDAAKRQLQDYVRRQRCDIKTHEVPPHGQIASLFPDEGYGFIETPDGYEIYFHRNSVLDGDFDQLEVGQEVRFAEEEGEQGRQASTVRVIGKHHLQD